VLEKFRYRSHQLERLDTGDYTAAEYARWAREMKFIHGLFGEVRALKKTLLNELNSLPPDGYSVLDVGAGSGGLLDQVRRRAVDKTLFPVGLELSPEAAGLIAERGLTAIQGDALKLPFADAAFDFVFCSLFLHHLDDERAAALVAEMARVARRRIFVIDLDRQPIPYYLFKYVARIALQRFTVEDGSLSILRSFTAPELKELAEKVGLENIEVRSSRANRLVLSGNRPLRRS
jgi:ubiquinone/menaquinone biosynthesis C-methylase UbiE